jgi:cytochrome c oxidase subunit 2
MGDKGQKGLLTEAWAFVAVAAIAFIVGLVIGDLGSSPKTETASITAPAAEAETEAETAEPSGGDASSGTQLFTDAGCGLCHTLAAAGSTGTLGPNLDESLAPDDTTEGIEEMIVDPNAEIVDGYAANVMPQDLGETLSPAEVHQLADYLVASTPAKP